MAIKIVRHPRAAPPDLNTVREWLAIICEIDDEHIRWLYRTDRAAFIKNAIALLKGELARTEAGYPYGD